MSRVSKKIITMLFFFFISTNIVKADVDIISGGLSEGSNSECDEVQGYIACYSSRFQFRVTLVDSTGEKLPGTNSVDFTYGYGDKIGNPIITKNVPFSNATVNLVNANFEYKYGNNENNKFQYVQAKLIEGDMGNYRTNGKDDHSKYSSFINEFMRNILPDSDLKRKQNFKYNNQSIDFLSLFAYLSGYTTKEVKNNDFTIESTTKAAEIAKNDYYLLIEPTFIIYYNTMPDGKRTYLYGTGRELVNWLSKEIDNNESKYNKGYLAGLSLNFVYQASCNMYTPHNNVVGFKVAGYTDCSYDNDKGLGMRIDSRDPKTNKYPTRSDRKKIMDEIMEITDIKEGKITKKQLKNGYGAYTLKLKNIIPTPPPDKTLKYNANLCTNLNNGKISFTYDSANKSLLNKQQNMNEAKKEIEKSLFLVNGSSEDSSGIFCYDNIEYDFSSMLDKIRNNNTPFNSISNVTIENGTVTVKRSCYFQGTTDNSFGKKFDSYKDKKFTLYAFGKTIDIGLVSEELDINTHRESVQFENGTTMMFNGWTDYVLTLQYGPKPINKTIKLSPYDDYDGEAYIDFSHNGEYSLKQLFGSDTYDNKNNNIVTYALDTQRNSSTPIEEFIIVLNENNKKIDGTTKCGVNYTIDDTPLPFDGGLQFRVISLSNPFPARDGTSRLPGTNWLDAKNYVYDYIDNNRAIQYKLGKIKENTEEKTQKEIAKADPNAMYTNTEPMYVIDLDASTMKKIREYNKDHTYTDIKLTCDSNNRQCTSDFLRNELEGVNIPIKLTGVCSNKEDYNEVLVKYNGITEERLRNVIYGGGFYQKSYDINKNLRNDTDDLEIFLNETDKDAEPKNTFFYTCADKSYLSGG